MELLISTAVPRSVVNLSQSEFCTQCDLALPPFNFQHRLSCLRSSSSYLRLRCRIPVTSLNNVFHKAVPTTGVTNRVTLPSVYT